MDFEENANKCVIFFLALQGSVTTRKKGKSTTWVNNRKSQHEERFL